MGNNWWQYYFQPLLIGSKKKASVQKVERKVVGRLGRIGGALPRERAHYLIQKYIRIRPHIAEKVTAFINEYFCDNWIIGVHYRGTDKSEEVPRVPYAIVYEAIENALKTAEDREKVKIFVATDEEAFLEDLLLHFDAKNVLFTSAIRSKDGRAVHISSSQNYQKGEDALIDCLLLSHSHLLIRTESCLSTVAAYFNPYVLKITCSRP